MRKALPQTALPIYSQVALAKEVEVKGRLYAAGTRGQIVEIHEGGVAYEVEFASPNRVVTLQPGDLISA